MTLGASTGTHAYGEPSYWDQRYRQDTGPFDWYQKYKRLAPLFDLYIRRSHRVLLVGCGNSTLGEDMASDGYLDIVNIDISSVVVEAMRQKYEDKPELKYITMDVRDMSAFESSSFDAVIDKGTLDSLMCGQNAHDNATKMLDEIGRVLKNNGVYILVDRTEKNPEQQRWELTKSLPLNQDDSSITALIGSHAEVHYIYVCIKDETLRRHGDVNGRNERV
ncbi:hypothetical protein KSP40_PGU012452 [Platanthera guangdongensis]|uniref:Methyltransferase type 11 domain-containing protein n=1 Tax=Platanthera guangdongensis TaxID=2320717 RepID=A0ABR2MS28_9ASPA